MATNFAYVPNTSPKFPKSLAEIPHPPAGLFVRGALPSVKMQSIAIVGTRRATPHGSAIAKKFARELAECGFAVISGLAFGIDAAAHEGCLEAGGQTVAVLPCGIDRIYPRSHTRLAERIIACNGALVSEYPPDTEVLPYRFLERNRMVSGMAPATLVIEAPEKSGALATARFAAEQSRDCLVIPGPVAHPNYVGSHELIRKGAQLVNSINHILEAYGIENHAANTDKNRHDAVTMSDDERKIFDAIKNGTTPLDVDKIANITKLQPQAVTRAATFLIMRRIIKEEAGGYVLH